MSTHLYMGMYGVRELTCMILALLVPTGLSQWNLIKKTCVPAGLTLFIPKQFQP